MVTAWPAVAAVRRGCNVGLLVDEDIDAAWSVDIDVIVHDALALLHLVVDESQSLRQVEVVVLRQNLARPVHLEGRLLGRRQV